jgi:glycosyltransferase involved in cell wall biosynthesis
MDKPNTLTIIIPSYNEELYIYNTLWFLSRQDLNLNVVVADGGSTDKTIDEVLRAKEKFTNLSIDIIKGGAVGVGRNNGAKFANTEYLLFMDADSILIESDIIEETLKNADQYDIITCKQKSTTRGDKKSVWVYRIFNWIRWMMPETFCTGCYFFISKDKFMELGGFDESLNNSEDFWLSRQVPKKKFKILNRYVGQDNRRFKKMGYWSFIKIVLLNYWYKNNINWFKKDVGYWEPYD